MNTEVLTENIHGDGTPLGHNDGDTCTETSHYLGLCGSWTTPRVQCTIEPPLTNSYIGDILSHYSIYEKDFYSMNRSLLPYRKEGLYS